MFIDWLTMYQDFDKDLPLIGDQVELIIDADTGQPLSERQPAVKYEGSYSTSITVRISGRRITVKGNPSRINRLDNLFGFTDMDSCVGVYNQILLSLSLPPFTKCTKLTQVPGTKNGTFRYMSDGATVTELHITTNKAVGKGNTLDYIKALSTQRYRNSIPRLHPNGCTLDWLSKRGNAPLIYADVYDKANEIDLHQLAKIKKMHGADSNEFRYLSKVRNLCLEQGVARFEQKLKARYLRRENLQHYGLSDYSKLNLIHNEFLKIDERLKVDAMTYETIAEQLIKEGVCKTTLSANSTANYAFMWMHGQSFNFQQSHIQKHRARLRQIGIDIAEPCDITKFSPVRIKQTRAIEVRELALPEWYKQPKVNHLRLVA